MRVDLNHVGDFKFKPGQTGPDSVRCTHFFGPRNSSLQPAGRASLIFTTYRVNHGVPRYGSTQCTAVHVSHSMAESKPCSYRLTVRCGTCIAHRWKPCGFRIPLMYGTNSTDENCSRRSLRAANIQYLTYRQSCSRLIASRDLRVREAKEDADHLRCRFCIHCSTTIPSPNSIESRLPPADHEGIRTEP